MRILYDINIFKFVSWRWKKDDGTLQKGLKQGIIIPLEIEKISILEADTLKSIT